MNKITFINVFFVLVTNLILSTTLHAGLWDYSMRWSHNSGDPVGQPNDHIVVNLLDPSVISSAADEQSTGYNTATSATALQIDSSTISSTVSTSKYFEYQFTTTNFADLVEVDAVGFIVYSLTSSGHVNDSGRYKVAVHLDDDPAFGSPEILTSLIQVDDDNPTLGASLNQTFYMPDSDSNFNRYEVNTPASLQPNTTYKLRVYIYDLERHGSLWAPAFANAIIWDDFSIYTKKTSSPTSTLKIITQGPLNCPSVITNGDFESASDGTFFGPNRSGSVAIPGWTVSGGGTDTYAVMTSGSAAITSVSAYMGSGGVRSVSSPLGATGFTFDADGASTNVPAAIEIRGPADDVSSVSGGTPGSASTCCDYGGQPLVMSQSFATTPGETYYAQFTVKGEGGTGLPGILKVDVPDGSGHVEIPANDGVRTYTVEFDATATASTLSFTNYGHFYQNSGGWCDPSNNGYCTVNGPTSAATTEPTIDDITVAQATCNTAGNYIPQACGTPGFIETFGSGVGRSPLPASTTTTYDYDEGVGDSNDGEIVRDDQYTILDKSSIAAAGSWWIVDDDHTGDTNGRMLMVNADFMIGEFYRQSITGLEVGKTYSFAAYIANADNRDLSLNRLLPNVKFGLESGGTEIASVTTGNIPQDPALSSLIWNQYELEFTATSTNVDIVLVNNNPGGSGNDLVIDDISISEVCPTATANITGTLFEDVNYGGGNGRDYATANASYNSTNVGIEATVELWQSDGASCIGSAPIQTTTANSSNGSYSFNNITGSNFCVRVVNSSVLSNRTIENWSIKPLAVQTFRTESTDGTGTITSVTNEVGGRSPLDVDIAAGSFDGTSGDGSIAQSFSVVNIIGGNVSGIDFGFNFDTIVNNNDAGQGSLRQFILNANALGDENGLAQTGQPAGRESSIFMLPNGSVYSGMKISAGNAFTSGVATINLQSELPDIVRSSVDINALTQTGSSCESPIVELNGASAGTGTNSWNGSGTSGLTIRRDDHYIRGLIINRFAANGIELFRDLGSDSSDNTHIECNWIGLDRTGTSAQGNAYGIGLLGMNSFVGNGSSSGRNVISGNTVDGIFYGGGGGLDNTIRGNYIGTDKDGTTGVGNARHGIHIYNTTGTSTGNTARIESNTIAFNTGVGVALAKTVPSPRNIRIKQNSIHSNGELGIDLVSTGTDAPQGVSANDSGDSDSAVLPNGLQNFPVITSAIQVGTDVDISGTLNSLADTNFEVELYSNQACNADASGTAASDQYGEGENFLSTIYVTTNSTGDGGFTTTIPYASLSGTVITALAANVTPGDAEEGNTSEFSACTNVTTCTGLSGEVNEAILTPQQLQPGKKVFIASSSIDDGAQQGHLRAYAIQSDGTAVSTVSWDAATTMTKPERTSRLYSTNSNGSLASFATLDDGVGTGDDAFDLGTLLEKATIINYTLDPSHDSGIYLGNRANNSMLGTISSDSDITQISRQVDTWNYLHDPSYRSFYNNTVSTRTERVLVTSNDGFLYAFNEIDGDIAWGWMPRSLIYNLTDFQTFQSKELMRGHIDVLDLKDTNGNYASYVVGSYKSGMGQFVLKLDSDSSSKSDLGSVVWDIDESEVNAMVDRAPNNGKRVYFSDSNNKVYSAYIVTADATSYLKIRSLTDTSVQHSIQLNYTATSTPYVMTDFGNASAPASKTLYLGDSSGNIYAAPLLASGVLDTANNINTAINGTAVAAMHTSSSSAVLYIGASSSDNGAYFLRAQSADRLTIFKYQSSQWNRLWTTYTGGAGKWTNATTYVADSNIQSLPATARISDEALIVSNSIVLPVSTAPTGSNCYRNAHYYLYNLVDGRFPTDRFYNTDNTAITTIVNLGNGEPETLKLSDFSDGKLLGYGISDQKSNGSVGINKTLYIKDMITTGIRSWRELR